MVRHSRQSGLSANGPSITKGHALAGPTSSLFFNLLRDFNFTNAQRRLVSEINGGKVKKKSAVNGTTLFVVCCGISQINPSCSALDKLNLFPAVKVMKKPGLHWGLFDPRCRHMSYTPRHQSLLRPKELQLTCDPSPRLPLSKVAALNLGRLTAF